jgi:pantoate--beta-alanine ligase
MRIVRTVAELRIALRTLREGGKRMGFVPTMGYLHEGHAALIRQSTARCGATVVSIFVNPAQFGPSEDLSKYPKDLESDQSLCLRMGVDLIFLPEKQEIYPAGFGTYVDPGRVAEPLCGQFRPGHFRGVATVVAKLFNMVQPDLAFFGQKDLQQTVVIRRMVKDLNLPVEVIVVPTIREASGLALSSRNAYLSEEERSRAGAISHGLFEAEAAYRGGERRAETLVALVLERVRPIASVQYCELVDLQSLQVLQGTFEGPAAIAIAAFVGTTRLIDNVVLAPSLEGAGLSPGPA